MWEPTEKYAMTEGTESAGGWENTPTRMQEADVNCAVQLLGLRVTQGGPGGRERAASGLQPCGGELRAGGGRGRRRGLSIEGAWLNGGVAKVGRGQVGGVARFAPPAAANGVGIK